MPNVNEGNRLFYHRLLSMPARCCASLPMDFLLHHASFDSNKTPTSAARLPYLRTTCRAAAQRVQRHMPDSIATLRWCIARSAHNPSSVAMMLR